MAKRMGTIWLVLVLVLGVCFPGVGVQAVEAVSSERLEYEYSVKDKCGLEPIVGIEVEGAVESEHPDVMGDGSGTTDSVVTDEERAYWTQFSGDYFYNQLNEHEKDFWDGLEEACLKLAATTLDAGTYGNYNIIDWVPYDDSIEADRLKELVWMFNQNHAQYYFLQNRYMYGGEAAFAVYDIFADGEARAEYTATFTQKIDGWLEEICAAELPEERIKIANDIVCENTTYARNDYDQSAYSMVSLGQTVCAGYAKTMNILGNAAGVDTISVTSPNHGWNMVKLHGEWYELDATWNDTDDERMAVYWFYNKSRSSVLEQDQNSSHEMEAPYPDMAPATIYDMSDSRYYYESPYFTDNGNTYFVVNDNVNLADYLVKKVAGESEVPATVTYNDVVYTVMESESAPTVPPSFTPTVAPTATPSPTPTVAPTATPSPTPTVAPTATPTPTPTVAPTAKPVEGEYHLPFTMKYDITNECFVLDLTLEAEGDLYLAYYFGSCMNPESAFEQATFTNSKTLDFIIPIDAYYNNYFWVVDASGNKVADAYPVYGAEVLNAIDMYYLFIPDNSRYNLDADFAADVEFVNGESLEDFDFQMTWGGKGKFTVMVPDVEYERFSAILFRDGVRVMGYHFYDFSSQNNTSGELREFDCSRHITESGEYSFVFWLEGEGIRSKNMFLPENYQYVLPSEKVAAPVNVMWSADVPGMMRFTLPEPERTGHYGLILEYKTDEMDEFVSLSSTSSSFQAGNKIPTMSIDFSNEMNQENAVYRVGVCAFSNDIEAYTHSEYVYTDIYDPSGASDDVAETLAGILEDLGVDSVDKADADSLTAIFEEASAEEKTQIAEALKTGLNELPVNELKVAMQTSSDTLDTVAAIESMTGVTVGMAAMDSEVEELVDLESVKVVGAALNAAEGEDVTLAFSKVTDYVPDSSFYKKAVPLGITLTGVANVETELDIPVRITMQVPEGIDINKLVILHLKQDGTVEEKFANEAGCAVDLETRTVSFTVTHFSTFVFAEEAEELTAEQQVRAFVERMYTVALGREAEEAGAAWWSDELLNGTSDGAGLAQGFLTGNEFKNKGYTNAQFVSVLYDTFFNRPIAEGEGDFWVNALNAGETRESVLSGFVNSTEFFNLCAEYGIARGMMKADGIAINSGIGQFAERLYTEVLGRAGEEEGMEYWANEIATGSSTPKDAAMRFFTSDEYLAKNTTNEAYLEALYRTFMGRDSDEAGMNFWLTSMEAGNDDRTSALESFAASEEFVGIMASYGL